MFLEHYIENIYFQTFIFRNENALKILSFFMSTYLYHGIDLNKEGRLEKSY